jgi:hypothetical protein
MSTPDYTCPQCGGHRFDVEVKQIATVLFLSDGDHQTDSSEGDLEWDGDSDATCCGCGYRAPLGAME